jgi:phosphoribosylanthranilate isomerase
LGSDTNGRATFVKICGITRIEDARAAAALGADAIGLIFWPRSPRAVDPAAARAIRDALPGQVTTVGVFVDQSEEEVARIADQVRLGAVQLHGAESPEYCARIRGQVIKAFGVDTSFDERLLDAYPNGITALLDTKDDVIRGGAGRRFDWTLAARVAASRRILLAGGLRPDNVTDALEQVRPYGIDVSSGIERAPGVKDHVSMQALFAAVRRADRLRTED